jgi:Glycosyl hydrolases family 39
VRSPRPLAALLAVLATVIVTGLAACSPGPSEPTTVSEQVLRAIEEDSGFTWEKQAAPLELGVTHTQNSLDSHDPDEATERGAEILRDNSAIWQNIHLMGFGTDNPEPSPGDYNWDTLDRRMELAEETGGKAMLTLCCAPDWMKGGEAGETDWSTLEDNPLPEHFGDYANLAAEAVKRYPQVERVLVWNELKGFYNQAQNRWDHEGYTEFYNQVYRAVKAVRPDIQVGGPYVVLISLDPGKTDASDQVTGPWGAADQRALDVVEYWLQHKVGADFVAVDAATKTRNDTIPSVLDGAQKFADLDRWLRERTDLPIWWAEFYPDVPEDAQPGAASPASATATLAAVAAYARSGASGALLWGPQGDPELAYAALWTDATVEDGGQPTPLTAAWQWLVPRLADGGVEIGRSDESPLLVFRASDGAVVVNPSAEPVQVTSGTPAVEPWAVTVVRVPH